MLRGTHVHNIFEALMKRRLETGYWKDSIEDIKMKPPDGVLSQEEIESYVDRLTPWLRSLDPVKGGVELWFDEVDGLPIRGKVDLVSNYYPVTTTTGRLHAVVEDDDLAVFDYKTIKDLSKVKTDYETRRSMQLRIYALATDTRVAGYIWLPPKSAVLATVVHFTEEDLRIAKLWLSRMLDSMLGCWARFLRIEAAQFGMTIPDDLSEADWSAWGLSHPDNFLCSSKWCDHWTTCLGATT
jgi:hypothetical protein